MTLNLGDCNLWLSMNQHYEISSWSTLMIDFFPWPCHWWRLLHSPSSNGHKYGEIKSETRYHFQAHVLRQAIHGQDEAAAISPIFDDDEEHIEIEEDGWGPNSTNETVVVWTRVSSDERTPSSTLRVMWNEPRYMYKHQVTHSDTALMNVIVMNLTSVKQIQSGPKHDLRLYILVSILGLVDLGTIYNPVITCN